MIPELLSTKLLNLIDFAQPGSWLSNKSATDALEQKTEAKDPNDYGVDVTSPIHHYIDEKTVHGKRYSELMERCYRRYSRPECDSTERARIDMNFDQPQHQHNYTELGFKKAKVPDEAWIPLKAFWDANKDKMKEENWPAGNTYVNHWDQPSYMVSLEDGKLRGAGDVLKKTIWNGIRPLLEEWVGRALVETSMYGIRVYKDKAVLATHVDRLPLVTSCIIQVDQDINEPWPVEVYSHDGKAYNITMKPGEVAFYESHTVLHGRPFPLNGSFYANLFVHFIPVDHDQMNAKDRGHIDHPFHKNTKHVRVGGHEQSNHDETEIQRHREDLEEEEYGDHEEEDEEGEGEEHDEEHDEGSERPLHMAAANGNLEEVKHILSHAEDADMVNAKDNNNWQAIHEAVRAGHLEVVQLLVDKGASLHEKTLHGGTPLWWARRSLEQGHSLIAFLEEIGAPEEGEEDL
eukprot:gene3564-7089_t